MAVLPVILPVVHTDLPILAEYIHSYKIELTTNRLLFHNWPNDSAQKPIYRQAVQSAFHDPDVVSLKAVNARSQELVGYLVLTRKKPGTTKKLGREESMYPEGMNPDVAYALEKAVADTLQKIRRQDHLGKGAHSQLNNFSIKR